VAIKEATANSRAHAAAAAHAYATAQIIRASQAQARANAQSTQQAAVAAAISTSQPLSFSQAFHAAMTQEQLGMTAITGVDLSAGNGSTTIPAIQNADRHFEKALSFGVQGGGSPFDDVGARFVNAMVDQAALALQMLGDYPDGPVQTEYNKIQADDQTLLRIQTEMHIHGY
jgi:hypothetical protein